jgi:hypothetical protein
MGTLTSTVSLTAALCTPYREEFVSAWILWTAVTRAV